MPAIQNDKFDMGPGPALQTGKYQISSAANDRIFISRSPAEDKSLLPKKIVTLAPGVEASAWDITKNADGSYTMKINGAPMVAVNKKMFAQLQEQQPKLETRWRLTSVYWEGENQYLIESFDRQFAWALPTVQSGSPLPLVQPELGILAAAASFPPQHSSLARFIIKKI
ncbi:hypothetical protein ABW20_dc0103546 [Dactylellina cionopaga]|nr:hypothetical protein ABW20_dc0103546 [Dactylellina cionopaga]